MARKLRSNNSDSSNSSSKNRSTRRKHARLRTSAPKNRTEHQQPVFSTRKFSIRSKIVSDRVLRMPAMMRRARENASRRRSIGLLYDLRTGEGSYSKLLKDYHLDTRTAHKYLGAALRIGPGGRVHANKSDRLTRELVFPSSSGDVPARIRGSKAASKLSEFFHDRGKLLGHRMSAEKFEAKWRGVLIAGQEVFADAPTIFLRQDAGDLKVDDLYGSVGGAE